MNRNFPHVERSLGVRLASALGAAALSAAVIGTLVTGMAPTGQDVSFVTATEVTITPSRIEVTGARATTTVRAASPHVG